MLLSTTNRPAVLDHAVRSRVMLELEYPDLDKEARAAVWQTMLTTAGLELVEGRRRSLPKPCSTAGRSAT